MQVGQLRCLSRHPVIPLLYGMTQVSNGHNAASDAGIRKLVCLHLCSQSLHSVGVFQKLLDRLPSAEHFVLEHGMCISHAHAIFLPLALLRSMCCLLHCAGKKYLDCEFQCLLRDAVVKCWLHVCRCPGKQGLCSLCISQTTSEA